MIYRMISNHGDALSFATDSFLAMAQVIGGLTRAQLEEIDPYIKGDPLTGAAEVDLSPDFFGPDSPALANVQAAGDYADRPEWMYELGYGPGFTNAVVEIDAVDRTTVTITGYVNDEGRTAAEQAEWDEFYAQWTDQEREDYQRMIDGGAPQKHIDEHIARIRERLEHEAGG